MFMKRKRKVFSPQAWQTFLLFLTKVGKKVDFTLFIELIKQWTFSCIRTYPTLFLRTFIFLFFSFVYLLKNWCICSFDQVDSPVWSHCIFVSEMKQVNQPAPSNRYIDIPIILENIKLVHKLHWWNLSEAKISFPW